MRESLCSGAALQDSSAADSSPITIEGGADRGGIGLQ
jgi:hypothetical protein